MAKQKQKTWQAVLDNVSHTFTLDIARKGYTLSVDGETRLSAPTKWRSLLAGYDLPFELNGRNLRLIISPDNKNVDIVADGRYLSNGKAYFPLPKWSWAFLFPIIPIALMGGALGALCGVLGFSFCIRVAKTSMNVALRVILCLAITALAWVAYFALALIFAGLVSG